MAPEAYREVVTTFYTGLSAMQTSQDVLAREKFDRVVTLAPQEPAGWANLGLLLLRQQEFDQGAERLARAATLAPESGSIQRLQALAEGRRGNLAEATLHWRKALDLNPDDVEAAYSLALDTERQGGPANEAAAERTLAELVRRRENLAARVEYARLAAKLGDQAALQAAAGPLQAASAAWSAEAQDQLKAMLASAAENPRAAATRVAFLKNFLLREPAYRSALAEVTTPREEVGQPLVRFLRLKNPEPQPAPADNSLAFAIEPLADAPSGLSWIGAVALTGEGNPVVGTAGPSGLRIAGVPGISACAARNGPGGIGALTPDAVAVADLNYDFRTDLALATAAGLCVLRQDANGRFTDVTAQTKLPAAVIGTAAYGLWPADVDTDGDLDLVLAPRDGHPLVLRNNGDGTFTPRDLFAAVPRARGFAWADLDGEGVPDAAFLDDAGVVRVFLNLRGGNFRAETPPPSYGQAVAIAVAAQGDSNFALIVLSRDGALTRLARKSGSGGWDVTPLLHVDPPAGLAPGVARLLTADLDNNGAADLIVAGSTASRVLLGGPGGSYVALPTPLALSVEGVADLDSDGRLELLGLAPGGQPVRVVSRGARKYHGRRSGRARPQSPATSASTRLASAARSRCVRACISRSR